MNEYRIIVGGIEEGIHSFTFDIKDSFFKAFSQSEVRCANIIATVLLEKELSLKLGVKLTINDKNNKGNIKIEYRNIPQRENIIKKLTGEN